jgi:site-specific DNA recombinase
MGGALVRNKHGALLKGLLRCAPCKCSMGHAYTSQGTKRYRYYVCLRAQKRGWHNCPTKSVPAGEIERFVIEQIKGIGKDPTVLAETLRQARGQGQRSLVELEAEERSLQRELARHSAALRKLPPGEKAGELANLQDRIRVAEQRETDVREQIAALRRELVDEREVGAALSVFDLVWDTLSPREQARIIHLLVERVDYDGKHGTVSVTFRPNGIKALARQHEEAVA